MNNFRLLSENKTLVCISKPIMGKNLKLTFFHSIKKTAILSTDSEFFALTGFSNRASAVRLDPKDLFKLSSKSLHFSSFEQIMGCTDTREIMNLIPSETMDKEKTEQYALLPPILYEELLDLEDLSPQNILMHILTKVRTLKLDPPGPTPAQIEENDDEDDGYVDISNQDLDKAATEHESEIEDLPFDGDSWTYEKKFFKTLCHTPDKINGIPTATCSIPSTMNWLEKIHREYLPAQQTPITPVTTQPPRFIHQPGQKDNNVGSSLNELATTLNFHYENEIKERAEKKKNNMITSLQSKRPPSSLLSSQVSTGKKTWIL